MLEKIESKYGNLSAGGKYGISQLLLRSSYSYTHDVLTHLPRSFLSYYFLISFLALKLFKFSLLTDFIFFLVRFDLRLLQLKMKVTRNSDSIWQLS